MGRYQYPSVTLNRRSEGDRELVHLYRGEANKLLFQLKNLMTFQKLGQLKMTRFFIDGTVITAQSIFGQDFINIDVTQRVFDVAAAVPRLDPLNQCTITLIDVPQWIQPMRYPGEIHEGEILGIDYIKTYYTVDKSTCPSCLEVEWNLCLQSTCTPFYFEDDSIPFHQPSSGIAADPDNHCQYTESMCQAEIVSQGEDDDGTYIIWKAFTEGPGTNVEFTRSGWGWMKLRPVIKLPDETEACFAEVIIDVDCCKKSSEERPVVLHWENCYGGIGPWCEVPDSVSRSQILWFQHWSWIRVPLILWAPTTQRFSCLEHDWSLHGAGKLIINDLATAALWEVSMQSFGEGGCQVKHSISVVDRCGTTKGFTVRSCCEDASLVNIGYTSLLMSCSASQTLTTLGGCPPYSWALTSGGGTLVASEDTLSAIYTAPATNANCVDNPTIKMTDCCGTTAQVSLTINCYTGADIALKMSTLLKCCCYKLRDPNCGGVTYNRVYSQYLEAWDCAGNVLQACWTGNRENCGGVCPPPPPCTNDCACDSVDEAGCWGTPGYSSGGCTGAGYTAYDTLTDVRTAAMKNQGCCPINPLTGLPY